VTDDLIGVGIVSLIRAPATLRKEFLRWDVVEVEKRVSPLRCAPVEMTLLWRGATRQFALSRSDF
jgi:hypothetical protein